MMSSINPAEWFLTYSPPYNPKVLDTYSESQSHSVFYELTHKHTSVLIDPIINQLLNQNQLIIHTHTPTDNIPAIEIPYESAYSNRVGYIG